MMENFSNRLAEVILSSGLSQKDFAKKAGVSQSFLSQIRSEKTKPNLDLLFNISNTFSVDLNWLVSGKGEMRFSESLNELLHHIPDDKNTRELLFWLKDDFVRFELMARFLEMKTYKYPDHFKEKEKVNAQQ